MGAASTFSLVTLSGPALALDLRGRALPYRGDVGGTALTFEGAMRAEFTWYPGNASATVQMLGAEEKSTVISGAWKDRFLKSFTDEGIAVQPEAIALFNGEQVEDALDLVLKVEQIRLSGQLLQMTWDGHTRNGILMRFKHAWKRREDVEWEMEFQWVSRGEAQTPPVLPDDPNTNDFATNLRTLVTSLKNALQPSGFQAIAQLTAEIETAVDSIDDAVLEVENAAAKAVAQVMSPAAAAERTLAAVRSIQASSSIIVTAVETSPLLQLIQAADPELLGLDDAINADAWVRDVKTSARDIQLSATQEADTLATSVHQETLLGSFIARDGIDLREVSTQFYGTPDEWRRLLQYNNLTDSQLSAGTLILVPKLDFSALET